MKYPDHKNMHPFRDPITSRAPSPEGQQARALSRLLRLPLLTLLRARRTQAREMDLGFRPEKYLFGFVTLL